MILSASAAAGCRLLLSEDLQEGFTWNGITVVNPFAAKRHELLSALLEEREGLATALLAAAGIAPGAGAIGGSPPCRSPRGGAGRQRP